MVLNRRHLIMQPNRLARIERNLQYVRGKYYLDNVHYTWDEILELILSLDKQTDLIIDRTLLPSIPNLFKRRLAEPFSSGIDYGYQENDEQAIHLKVMQNNYYHIHWESRDPNVDPIGHLIHDASHWLIGIGVAIFAGLAIYHTNRK